MTGLAWIEEAELRGRGGASFSTARKWGIARLADAPEKHVVANGAEHEPGSRKDRLLLTARPHLVIEGAILAAYATGARTAWIYVIEDMHDGWAKPEHGAEHASAPTGGAAHKD